MKIIREKIIGSAGSISGAAGILGSWQVCHNVCLVIVAALGIIGITVTGMPLEFLTKIAVPVWSVAVFLLAVTAFFYFTKKCISKSLLLFNTGLITAGIPFWQDYNIVFWSVGGIITLSGIIIFIKGKLHKGRKTADAHHKISYEDYMMYGLLAIVFIGLIYSFIGFFGAGFSQDESGAMPNSAQSAALPAAGAKSDEGQSRTVATGTTDTGDVSVELTPGKIVDGILEVDIAINTHSVALDDIDLKKATVLEYGSKKVNPASAPKLSGHHNSGTLKFEVDEDISAFVIKIKGIPAIEERVFEWK